MTPYRRADWDAAEAHPSTVGEPYLMTTGVVVADQGVSRPLAAPHSHPDAMLAWCYRGTVWVYLQDVMWRLAPGQGIWVPAGTPHTSRHEPGSTGCYTYLPDTALDAPVVETTRVLVPRAVQEMLLHLGADDMDDGLRVRIQAVVVEMLQQPSPRSADGWGEVPLPADERLRPLVQAVLADPGDPRTARELFDAHGLHERTVLRVLQRDVGTTFARWRTGVRMTQAARMLIDGTPVGLVAHRSGYATTSAFSAAFKQRFGLTPREHVARVRTNPAHHLYWR